FIPVAAAVVLIQAGTLLEGSARGGAGLSGEAEATFRTLLVLGNGFIVTAVLWGSAVATIIDRRLALAAAAFAVASVATLVGVIHSPLAGGGVFWPWAPPSTTPATVAGAYGLVATLCWFSQRRAAAVAGDEVR
ncbi:MAG: hypothetical protein ACREJG_13120, partial [Candidatus Rokuibacteriota bacterium]